MADIRVGISGWTYPPWRGNFYPQGLPHKRELAYASRRFNALEINGTFYSLQRPSSYESWYEATPENFAFSVKGPRYLTHMLKLKEPQQPLANFFASGPLCLREKLGVILWQFPPNFSFHEDRFKAFFELLPHDTEELAHLGKKHDLGDKEQVHLEVDVKRPVRHAVEFRHESFLTDRFTDLLHAYRVALVVADAASKYPTAEDVTTDFVYVRLHGSRQLYVSGYEPKEIDSWAKKIRVWHQGREPEEARRIGEKAPAAKHGRDVLVFFDNTDVKQRAPVDARAMAEELGIAAPETERQVLEELGIESEKLRPRPTRKKKRTKGEE